MIEPSLGVADHGAMCAAAWCMVHDEWSQLAWDGSRLAPRCCLNAARTTLREELIHELRGRLADSKGRP